MWRFAACEPFTMRLSFDFRDERFFVRPEVELRFRFDFEEPERVPLRARRFVVVRRRPPSAWRAKEIVAIVASPRIGTPRVSPIRLSRLQVAPQA